MDFQFLVIQLLLKMGVATAVASALGRAREFKKLLFAERRSRSQSIVFVLFASIPFALGVYIRTRVKNFQAADLGFEASILVGVMGGRLAGTLGGAILALPAMFHGEYLTLPVNLVSELLAGSLQHLLMFEFLFGEAEQ